MSVIEVRNLTKDFRVGFWKNKPVRALDDLCLEVNKGDVFGFLGPNGAGKTTTLKLLMNLLRATAGSARILGEPVESVSMRRRIGYLPENPYFYDYLTPDELLAYVGSLFGIRQPALGKKVRGLLEKVGLAESGRLQLRKFSKGMVQRIGIAQAIINDPEVVFLDEPMSGLDPLGRREVREVIVSLKDQGVTVFFSSHILPDVEALCDRVAILRKGKLQAVGALEEILRMKIEAHEIILACVKPEDTEQLRSMSDALAILGDRLHLRASTSAQIQQILAHALAKHAELISVNPVRPSLEDYFLHEVGSGRGEASRQ
jgi:ABC-2 type transport system ATP-binding protein